MGKYSRSTGFTLLEVLVALAILGTSMYGGFYLLHRSIANAGIIEEKIVAHWVTKNALAKAELAGQEVEEFEVVDELVTMYGREFSLSVNTELIDQKNAEEALRTKLSVNIRVTPADEPSRTIEELIMERLL